MKTRDGVLTGFELLVDGGVEQSAVNNTFIAAIQGQVQDRFVVFHTRADDLNQKDANGRIDIRDVFILAQHAIDPTVQLNCPPQGQGYMTGTQPLF